jgi:hypothetical protein
VYPGDEPSSYTLYEDDGKTFAYQSGAYATTQFICRKEGNALRVAIGARTGEYADKPAARAYVLCLHTTGKPLSVDLNGAALAEFAGGREALLRDGAPRGWTYGAEDGITYVKPDAGWRLTSDARGAADVEQDTLEWTSPQRPSGNACEITLQLSPRPGAAPTRTARPYALSPVPPIPAPVGAPDRLHVVANPPERIALKWGDWLAHKTNLYVSVMSGAQIDTDATCVVRMDVVDTDGTVIRHEEKPAQRGRVEFLNTEYKPGLWTFRFSSAGLQPCEVTIRPAVQVPGQMFGPA